MKRSRWKKAQARTGGDVPNVPALPPVPLLPPLTLRATLVHGLLVFVPVLLVYLLTMPRDVTMEDSGLFIMSSYFAGISHPPGYPIHSLLGKLATLLPFATIPVRVHLVSALFGAGTCVVLWHVVRTLGLGTAAAYVAALAYGVSRELWSQAIIAEVYTLNTFYFFLLLLLSLQYVGRAEPRTLKLLGLVFGLSLAHHWPLIGLSAPGLALILWPRRRELLSRLTTVVPFVLLGLTPYLYVIIRSNTDPMVSFYGPLDSAYRVIHFVMRWGYGSADVSPTADWSDKLAYAWVLAKELGSQYTLVGAVAAVGGAVLQWRRAPRSVTLGCLVAFAGATLLLLGLLRLDDDSLHHAVIRVYPIIPYGVMALWLAIAWAEVTKWVSARVHLGEKPVGITLGAALILATLVSGLGENDRHGYAWAGTYARGIVSSLDPRAILITQGDANTALPGYARLVEGLRPDVDLYNDNGLVFRTRLFHPVGTSDEEKRRALAALARTTDRPVYYFDELSQPSGVLDYGVYKRIDRTLPDGTRRAALSNQVLDLFEAITRGDDQGDTWSVCFREQLFGRLSLVTTEVLQAGTLDPTQAQRADAVLKATQGSFTGRLMHLQARATTAPPETLLAELAALEQERPQCSSKWQRGRLYYLTGLTHIRMKRLDDAAADFVRSIAAFPDPQENGAVLNLLQYYALKHQRAPFDDLRRRFYPTSMPPEVSKLAAGFSAPSR